jgi:probable HAF family extracellular repeat protein
MKSRLLFALTIPSFTCILADTPSLAGGPGEGTITNVAAPPGASVQVNALSSAGQLTGFYYIDGAQDPHAFRYLNGSFTDLGTLGGTVSEGLAINSSGVIAGDGYVADFDFHAFVTGGDGLLDLGTLGGTYTSPVAINDAGQVAGSSQTDAGGLRAFLYSGGNLTSLGEFGGDYSFAYALNSLGIVVGVSALTNGNLHGFVWSSGSLADIGTLGGSYSTAYAVNDSGVVAGESYVASGDTHAFAFANGLMKDLGTLGGGTYSTAFQVNSNGQVIGYGATASGSTHGFAWLNGSLVDLGDLGGDFALPLANNNRNQVVGYSATANNVDHAFLWQNGQIIDLNSLLPADSGWELTAARFINDSGRVVGDGTFGGVAQPFILDLPAGNSAPIAVAGSDRTVSCGDQVTLDGSQSSDPDQDPLSFAWTVGGTLLGSDAKLAVTLPLGTNVVTLTVTDPSGASSQANVVITVVDLIAPTFACPANVTASSDANCQALVPDLVSHLVASDNCTPPQLLKVTQQPAAGTALGLGQYPVLLTVTDSSGNSAHCTVTFTVADTTPPAFQSLTVTPNVLNPPNHQIVPVIVSASVSDNCDSAPTCRIVSITANESTAAGDIAITGPMTANLAASRNAGSNGRTYTITVASTDASGNSSTATIQVTVPKGNGNGNSGPSHP